LAFDAFLKLDGIPGDSVDAAHKGEIQVSAFQGGLSNPAHVGSATGGAGAGKATFQDFQFTAPVSSATPKLLLACATGQHITTATLAVRRAGAAGSKVAPLEFLKYTLTNVVVSSVTTAGASADASPHEQFSLAFAKLQVSYQPQNAAGGAAGPPVTGGWDLGQNKQA
jgi:type VI secretion system secreted protein Hcp